MRFRTMCAALALGGALISGCAAQQATAQAVPAPVAQAAPDQALGTLDHPSGVYGVDRGHVSVIWRVSHLGFSMYTGRFNDVQGTLTLNAAEPLLSSLDIAIAAASVDTGHRNAQGQATFDQTIANAALGAQANPTIRFVSTAIASNDGRTGTVTGDLTLNGVTRPVTLDVTFNGGRLVALTQKYTLGFSARTTIKRSDYGVTNWAGGIGDDVEIIIEAEFQRQ